VTRWPDPYEDLYDSYDERDYIPDTRSFLPAFVLCSVCKARCEWRSDPGRGWRLYESGKLHTCKVAMTEMENLDAK
jgi:hypothetical protein